MAQGELYVYSMDGNMSGVDTIRVEGGRFTYETACEAPATLMLVFPNFSEIPIFAESGKSVSVKGDASHLKELSIKGTDDNDLMNTFREQIQTASPPEEKQLAEQFVRDHAESAVSFCLVRKYFVTTSSPDYRKAEELLRLITKEQSDNVHAARLLQQVSVLKSVGVGVSLPAFTAYDTNGKLVSSATLASAPVTVVTTWSTTVFESLQLLRELRKRQRSSLGKLQLLSICIDGNKTECKRTLERDSISWPNICNGELLADKTLLKLGLTSVPDNLVLKNGKIVARSLNKKDLNSKLDQLLK